MGSLNQSMLRSRFMSWQQVGVWEKGLNSNSEKMAPLGDLIMVFNSLGLSWFDTIKSCLVCTFFHQLYPGTKRATN